MDSQLELQLKPQYCTPLSGSELIFIHLLVYWRAGQHGGKSSDNSGLTVGLARWVVTGKLLSASLCPYL